jgi:phage terminase small subunit
MARSKQPTQFAKANLEKRERKKKPPVLKPLSDQQKALVDWYFHPEVRFVKREAMRRAGYAESTACNNPTKIFTHPSVAAAIEQRHEDRKIALAVDANYITERLMWLADANIAKILKKLQDNGGNLDALTWVEQYQISEFKVKHYMMGRGEDAIPVTETSVKAESRRGALDSMAKLHGLNKEKEDGQKQTTVQIIMSGRHRMRATVTEGQS